MDQYGHDTSGEGEIDMFDPHQFDDNDGIDYDEDPFGYGDAGFDEDSTLTVTPTGCRPAPSGGTPVGEGRGPVGVAVCQRYPRAAICNGHPPSPLDGGPVPREHSD